MLWLSLLCFAANYYGFLKKLLNYWCLACFFALVRGDIFKTVNIFAHLLQKPLNIIIQ